MLGLSKRAVDDAKNGDLPQRECCWFGGENPCTNTENSSSTIGRTVQTNRRNWNMVLVKRTTTNGDFLEIDR